MSAAKLPAELRAAYEWIDSAGEWTEALKTPARYAREAAANWRAEGDGDEVTESDVRDVIDWRKANPPRGAGRPKGSGSYNATVLVRLPAALKALATAAAQREGLDASEWWRRTATRELLGGKR